MKTLIVLALTSLAFTPHGTNAPPPPLPPSFTNTVVHHWSTAAKASSFAQPDDSQSWSIHLTVSPIHANPLEPNGINSYIIPATGQQVLSNWTCQPITASMTYTNGPGALRGDVAFNLRSPYISRTVLRVEAQFTHLDGSTASLTGLVEASTFVQWVKITFQAAGDGMSDHDTLGGGTVAETGMAPPENIIYPPLILVPPAVPPAKAPTPGPDGGPGDMVVYAEGDTSYLWSNPTAQIDWSLLDSSTNYSVLTSDSITGPWTNIDTITTDAYGNVEFFEPANGVTGFYRIIEQ
jgi:hypothetical protein